MSKYILIRTTVESSEFDAPNYEHAEIKAEYYPHAWKRLGSEEELIELDGGEEEDV